jgi:hypothetical protein
MLKKENLKSYIDELIKEVEEELDESSTTGGVDGYQTPFAFSGKGKKDKAKADSNIEVTGYTKVKDIDEAYTSFVSGNSGRTTTHLDNKKYQLTKDINGVQIGNYNNVVLPKGSIIHNLPGGVFVNHPSLKDKFSGIKETPKFGFRVTTKPDTLISIEKSSKILESVNEEKVYIDFLNKKKGFKQDRIKFNSYEDAVKWARKNFDKFDPDMIKYEAYDHTAPNVKDNPTIIPKNYIAKLSNNKTKMDAYLLKDGSYFIVKIIAKNTKQQIDGGKSTSTKDILNYLTKKGFDLQPLRDAGILKSKNESVNEGKSKRPVNRWLELKNDESMHANKKLAVGLKELKHQLSEVEKFFRWYNQIKTMNELSSDVFWKRTHGHIYKIKERLINIAKTIQEIEK